MLPRSRFCHKIIALRNPQKSAIVLFSPTKLVANLWQEQLGVIPGLEGHRCRSKLQNLREEGATSLARIPVKSSGTRRVCGGLRSEWAVYHEARVL